MHSVHSEKHKGILPGTGWRSRLLLCAVVMSVFPLVGSIACAQQVPARKLIEWGWDEPDTKFMRANIEKMERFPFDGLVFHPTSGKGENIAGEAWGSKKFAPAATAGPGVDRGGQPALPWHHHTADLRLLHYPAEGPGQGSFPGSLRAFG